MPIKEEPITQEAHKALTERWDRLFTQDLRLKLLFQAKFYSYGNWAEDIVAGAMVRGWVGLPRLADDGKFVTYMRRIVEREAISCWRRESKRLTVPLSDALGVVDRKAELLLPHVWPEAMPLTHITAMALSYEGYTEKEIASALGLTVPAAKCILCRARKAMRLANEIP